MSTTLEYTKAHATGNDFVLSADPEGTVSLSPEKISLICDRHRGIGADGFIRAVPSALIPEGAASLAENPTAVWFMDYYNSDGTHAQMCGNGVRAFVEFLRDRGLVVLAPGEVLPIATRGGVKYVRITSDGYAVDMGEWNFIYPAQAQGQGIDSLVIFDGLAVSRPALSISLGNPHTVVAFSTLNELEHVQLYRAPVVDPLPPEGTNVECVVPHEPLVEGGIAKIAMRVHERGVGETQSCGTGACAAVIAVRHWSQAHGLQQWSVAVPGGTVGVKFIPSDKGSERVELSGTAQLVAHGTFL